MITYHLKPFSDVVNTLFNFNEEHQWGRTVISLQLKTYRMLFIEPTRAETVSGVISIWENISVQGNKCSRMFITKLKSLLTYHVDLE